MKFVCIGVIEVVYSVSYNCCSPAQSIIIDSKVD